MAGKAESGGADKPDLSEKGGPKGGEPQSLDTRLFMQLLAFGGCPDARAAADAFESAGIEGVIYEDVNDPTGIAALTFSPDPAFFVTELRKLLNAEPFASFELKPSYTMLGRTYSIGYEPDLEDVLLNRPRRTACNPEWPWAVWYPLRRSGAFADTSAEEQRKMLMEHGSIGRSFGEADYAHDVRLACFGLDANDNDFVVGLTGKELFPLSAVVQAMRKTVQTSQYIEKLGPFFIGRAVWQRMR